MTSNPGPDRDFAYAAAVDATHIYITGDHENPTSGDWQWRVEKRSLVDGSLDPGFGTAGVVTENPGIYADSPGALAIDAGWIFVAINDESPGQGDWQWRLEKRSTADGLLDPGFGSGGVVTENPSIYGDAVWALAIDAGWIFAAGYDESPGQGDRQWRLEKRSTADGSLDPGFGSGGVVTSNPSSQLEQPYAAAVYTGSIYIGGYEWVPGVGDRQWRIEKRFLLDGSLDPGFGTGGVVTSNPSFEGDEIRALAIDEPFLYVAGHEETLSTGRGWRVEKRALNDGAPDPCFGTAGAVTSIPSSLADTLSGIALDASSLIIVGDEAGDLMRIEKRFK